MSNTKSTVVSGNKAEGLQKTNITSTLVVADADGMSNPNYTVKTAPKNGTASIDPVSGEWVYTPNGDFYGKDNFLVTVVDDAGFTSTQYVFVTVNQTPQKPASAESGNKGEGEEGQLIENVLKVTDINGISNPNFQIAKDANNGTATIDPVSGEWTYQPNEGFVGKDLFLVKVTDDGGFTSTMYVTLNVTESSTESTDGLLASDEGLEGLLQDEPEEASVLSSFSAPQAISLPEEDNSEQSNDIEGFGAANTTNAQTAQFDAVFFGGQDLFKDLIEPTNNIV